VHLHAVDREVDLVPVGGLERVDEALQVRKIHR